MRSHAIRSLTAHVRAVHWQPCSTTRAKPVTPGESLCSSIKHPSVFMRTLGLLFHRRCLLRWVQPRHLMAAGPRKLDRGAMLAHAEQGHDRRRVGIEFSNLRATSRVKQAAPLAVRSLVHPVRCALPVPGGRRGELLLWAPLSAGRLRSLLLGVPKQQKRKLQKRRQIRMIWVALFSMAVPPLQVYQM